MVVSTMIRRQYKNLSHRSLLFFLPLAGWAQKQEGARLDNQLSSLSSFFSTSPSSSSSSSSSSSENESCLCCCLTSHSSTRQPRSQNLRSGGRSLDIQLFQQKSPFLYQSHLFHTSCADYLKDNEPYKWKGREIISRYSPKYLLKLTYIALFNSMEFYRSIEADFIERAPEALVYLLKSLQTGNMRDMESIVTERGSGACLKLRDDLAGSEDLLMGKDDVSLLQLCGIDYVKKAENPHLVLETELYCVEYRAYERRDAEHEWLKKQGGFDKEIFDSISPKRVFLVKFLVYLDDQQKQSSGWLIDHVQYKSRWTS